MFTGTEAFNQNNTTRSDEQIMDLSSSVTATSSAFVRSVLWRLSAKHTCCVAFHSVTFYKVWMFALIKTNKLIAENSVLLWNNDFWAQRNLSFYFKEGMREEVQWVACYNFSAFKKFETNQVYSDCSVKIKILLLKPLNWLLLEC